MTDQLDTNAPENLDGEVPETTTSETSKPTKPQTRVDFMIKSFQSFTGAKGKVYALVGTEVGGKSDRDRKAVAFRDTGKAIETHLNGMGLEDLTKIDPAMKISLAGNWNKRTWNGSDGKPRHTWEFNISDFSFDGPVKIENEKKPAAKRDEDMGETRAASRQRQSPERQNGDAADGTAGAKADRPLKDLDLTVTKADFRYTASGTACLNLRGKNARGQWSQAVVWAEDAERLSNTIGELNPTEEQPAQIALKGYWKKSTWNKNGKDKESYEFVVKQFSEPTSSAPQAEPKQQEQAPRATSSRDYEPEIPF